MKNIGKYSIACVFLIVVSGASYAQGFLKKLGQKAENVGSDLIINKSKQKAEKAIDGTSNGKKGDSNKNGEATKEEGKVSAQGSNPTSFKAYSKFDFVPGEKVVFADNFDQDVIGELPVKWFSNGSGEVVTVDGIPGKWVMMSSGSLLSPTFKIPENFTYEFDLIINLPHPSQSIYPGLAFEMYDRGDKLKRVGYDTYTIKNVLFFKVGLHQNFATFELDSRENGKVKLVSEKVKIPAFASRFKSVIHVAISVQKERLRMWFDADKIFDIPVVVANQHNFNQIKVSGQKSREGDPAFYFSNFKIAAGLPDTRSKLLTEGRFVTTGILFDSGSDKIKSGSSGVLKEIAAALKENAGVKVKIIGHTDTDGSAATNLSLSKKRAEAVKKALVDEYGLTASLIETDGKGSTQPVGDNNTSTGRAENRRVEFVTVK